MMLRDYYERPVKWLFAPVVVLVFSGSCNAQERYVGDARRLTDLLGEKATIVGSTGNIILLQKGTTLFRCELTEILEPGRKQKARDGTSLYSYKSRGCVQIEEQ
jgi:hypothetical protein